MKKNKKSLLNFSKTQFSFAKTQTNLAKTQINLAKTQIIWAKTQFFRQSEGVLCRGTPYKKEPDSTKTSLDKLLRITSSFSIKKWHRVGGPLAPTCQMGSTCQKPGPRPGGWNDGRHPAATADLSK